MRGGGEATDGRTDGRTDRPADRMRSERSVRSDRSVVVSLAAKVASVSSTIFGRKTCYTQSTGFPTLFLLVLGPLVGVGEIELGGFKGGRSLKLVSLAVKLNFQGMYMNGILASLILGWVLVKI